MRSLDCARKLALLGMTKKGKLALLGMTRKGKLAQLGMTVRVARLRAIERPDGLSSILMSRPE